MRVFHNKISYLITTLLLAGFIVISSSAPIKAQSGYNFHEISRIGDGYVKDLAWHPHRPIIAVASTLGIWLYSHDFAEISHIETPDLVSSAVSWNPDGTQLAVGDTSGIVHIWSLSEDYDFQPLMVLEGHNPEDDITDIFTLTWSADGRYLTSSTVYDTITWDVEAGQINATYTHDGHWFAHSPDGALGTRSHDFFDILIHNFISGEDRILPLNETTIIDMTFLSNETLLVATRVLDAIVVWEVSIATGQQEVFARLDNSMGQDIFVVKWNRDGSLISGISSSRAIITWDVRTGDVLQAFHGFEPVSCVKRSPDGNLCATSTHPPRQIYIWSTLTARRELTISIQDIEPYAYWTDYAWSPDGTRIATTSSASSIYIWDA